jgi:hypothetical protein
MGEYRLRYSAKHIIAILDSYSIVAGGDFDSSSPEDSTKKANRDIYRAPYENSIIAKADIDIAIDRLGIPGCWSVWCRDIEQSPVGRNLSPKQYQLAQYIQGNGNHIDSIAYELSKIA